MHNRQEGLLVTGMSEVFSLGLTRTAGGRDTGARATLPRDAMLSCASRVSITLMNRFH